MVAEYDDRDFVDGLFNGPRKNRLKPKDREERKYPYRIFLLLALKQRCWRLKAR